MAVFSRVAPSLNLAIPPLRVFAELCLIVSCLLFLGRDFICRESWSFRLPTHNIFVSLRMSSSRPQLHSSHFPKGESFCRIVRASTRHKRPPSPPRSPLCFFLSIFLGVSPTKRVGEHLLWGNGIRNPWSLKWFSVGNLNSCSMWNGSQMLRNEYLRIIYDSLSINQCYFAYKSLWGLYIGFVKKCVRAENTDWELRVISWSPVLSQISYIALASCSRILSLIGGCKIIKLHSSTINSLVQQTFIACQLCQSPCWSFPRLML